jgi:hypothetical protein
MQTNNLYDYFKSKVGTELLIVTTADQLNLLGQTFRPVFCGKIEEVHRSHLKLSPVTVKLVNAPYYKFPTPLNIPYNKIAHFTENFDCDTKFPLT